MSVTSDPGQGPPHLRSPIASPDRKGEHSKTHLAESTSILQADADSGFRGLYEKPRDGSPPQF